MEKRIVRLQKIELYNLKNVGKGIIQFSCNAKNNIFENKADLLGIYGQNGSGKTTLIYALGLFKNLVMGKKLGKDCINYIKLDTDNSLCHFEFIIIDADSQHFKVIYEFKLKKSETAIEDSGEFETDEIEVNEKLLYVAMEKISASKLINDKWTKLTPILCYDEGEECILTPQIRLSQLTSGDKNIEDELRVAKLFAKKSSRSFLFFKDLSKIIQNSKIDEDYKNILNILKEYSIYNLHVISNMQTGIINANIALPLSFVSEKDDRLTLLSGNLNLNGISQIPKKFFSIILDKINIINMVLKEIIPGLTIKLQQLGSKSDKNNEEIVLAQIIANREKTEIPLKYESDGIKKLISILHGLVTIFNNPSATLAVDEFDSGIFEYLLGEILKIVEEYGKGQLIFTSHNLRPLEVLNKKNIMFTTTNENNRYIRFKNIKANNNFRDSYFHDIILGGQNECIYEAANPHMIRRAFRLAGDEDAK